MTNIRHKKCIKCKRIQASFNYPGKKGGLYCSKCKLDGMTDITSPICIKCKNTHAVYNYPEEKKKLYCLKCKLDGMINIKSSKCIKCKKIRASFNYCDEKKPLYCSKCKLDEMVDIIHKKCIKCKITTPVFNYSDEKKPLYCSKCKLDGMIDIISLKCKQIKCPIKGNKKYKGYCTFCYQHLFPNDPLTFQIRCKTKEMAVRCFINSNYNGFHHDQPLYTGECDCTMRRRIDHRKLINNTILAIETDEHQHKYYNKQDEKTRYDDLFMIHSGKWVFIRFNPDKYKKNNKTMNPSISTRLRILKKEIDCQMKRIESYENTNLMEIIHLYYDEF